MNEAEEIIQRYERRKLIVPRERYSALNPSSYMSEQEKERTLIKLIKKTRLEPLEDKKLLEIGCGGGNNLIQFIRLGFNPENLFGNDILSERIVSARGKLPSSVTLIEGDASKLNYSDGYFDIVFQSMVFSSILDEDFRTHLAKKMWQWTKKGGGILWYDFVYDNPKNKDVKGIRFRDLDKYFPMRNHIKYKLTLAPPISRVVTKIHPYFYTMLNSIFFLKTHILCFIRKTD